MSIQSQFDVSRETMSDLEAFVSLVEKWNPRINLVSKVSLELVWERHVWDSWQVLSIADDIKQKWTDIGSGGGFPGLLVAIHAKYNCPERQVTLIESDSRKCQFLRTVSRELKLNTKVMNERVEKVEPMRSDVVSARALTALEGLLTYADRHLTANGILIAPKGASYQSEIEAARLNWMFDCTVHPSKTNQDAAILEIGSIKHV